MPPPSDTQIGSTVSPPLTRPRPTDFPAVAVRDDGASLDPPRSTWSGSVAEQLAVATAPSTGRFRPHGEAEGAVRVGQLLGHVTGGGGRADPVHCPVDAELRALLVRTGQLVTRGQGLVWLHTGEAAR